MTSHFAARIFVVIFAASGFAAAAEADSYQIDPAHSSVSFKIQHMGISWVQGRFNEFSGACTLDGTDPSKSSFEMSIKAASVDTNQPQRDNHLRSPDFFDAKQFPTLSFKSTAVKKVDAGLEVTGDFTLHGVTKSITLTLSGGQETEFPKGARRVGFYTDLEVKRSDYGMNKMIPDVGDVVKIFISFEAVKK